MNYRYWIIGMARTETRRAARMLKSWSRKEMTVAWTTVIVFNTAGRQMRGVSWRETPLNVPA